LGFEQFAYLKSSQLAADVALGLHRVQKAQAHDGFVDYCAQLEVVHQVHSSSYINNKDILIQIFFDHKTKKVRFFDY